MGISPVRSICLALIATIFAHSGALKAAALSTEADFAVIMDYESGEVLFQKNADVQTAPASMSKLMTVAIVFEKLKAGELSLDTPFAVSEKAWRMGGSKMWVRVDTSITLENLLRGVIIQSGNDACIVIAENIAGTEEAFAQLMNRKAREWGLDDSRFANATGWPHPDHKMSMRDLAMLARKIIRDYPEYYALFSEREFTWEKIRQENRNPILLSMPGADGLKTGHTDEAGYGVVGAAVRNGRRRIIVVNGLESEEDRSRESLRLMNIAFNDFERVALFSAGDVVGAADVFAGAAPSAPLVVREDIGMTVHRADRDAVRATVIYEGPIKAPVEAGRQIGYLRVSAPTAGDGGEIMREYPLYTAAAVAPADPLTLIGIAAKRLLAKPDGSKDAGTAAADRAEGGR